jgi:hypothetical protein
VSGAWVTIDDACFGIPAAGFNGDQARRSGAIIGRVVDAETETPLPGALITIRAVA